MLKCLCFLIQYKLYVIFRYGMDRLVEDLIQESMAKGDFDNLSGKGKPLTTKQDHHNPYVDLVTHKLNQVGYIYSRSTWSFIKPSPHKNY